MKYIIAGLVLIGALTRYDSAYSAELSGFISSKSDFGNPRVYGLFPTNRVPVFQETLELNLISKAQVFEQFRFYGDVSAFGKLGYQFLSSDLKGQSVAGEPEKKDRRSVWLSVNELFLNYEIVPQLSVLVGKKRVMWGSGFSSNPTDLLNPPKNAIDPAAQRKGSWLGLIENPHETVTFSALGAVEVTDNDAGIPEKIFRFSTANSAGQSKHFIYALRAYSLISEGDLNLMVYYSNLYQDTFKNKFRGGVSYSKYATKQMELHSEILLQQGSSRQYVDSKCIQANPLVCVKNGIPLFASQRLESKSLTPQLLLGGRFDFENESALTLEFLHQNDGYTSNEFEDFVHLMSFIKELRLQEKLAALTIGNTDTDVKSAGKMLMKNYAILNYQRYKFKEDFWGGFSWILNLQDSSGLVSPSLTWNPEDWCSLGVSGLATFSMNKSAGATRTATESRRTTEYDLFPSSYRLAFDMKAYF